MIKMGKEKEKRERFDCPVCNSSQVYVLFKSQTLRCRSCGTETKLEDYDKVKKKHEKDWEIKEW